MSRPDFSEYVVHLTKGASPLGAKEHPDDEAIRSISGTAYERLISILTDRKVIATPMPWTNKKAVAFTECPWGSLIDHARRYSSYGLGFTKARLFATGGGPAVYLRPDLFEKQHEFVHKSKPAWTGLHPDLYAFVTPFVPVYAPKRFLTKHWSKGPVDFTHEREWRVPHDFTFQLTQVQFIVINSYEDVAMFPKELKNEIGREKFLIMDVYQQIERIWPIHIL